MDSEEYSRQTLETLRKKIDKVTQTSVPITLTVLKLELSYHLIEAILRLEGRLKKIQDKL